MPDTTESAVLLQTDLPGVTLLGRGKVRDVYALGDKLLIVASDRISAFDYILATGIPGKGRILTQLSVFWFDFLRDVTPTHFIAADVDEYPEALRAHRGQLEGRSMLVKRAKMMDVECVARGYLAGSGWKEYRENGTVCGIPLPTGLRESDRLAEPIFTPSTKAEIGTHDENISFEQMVSLLGQEAAEELRRLSLSIYSRARDHAATRGIIIADTKFEFGVIDGRTTLVDEVLTPDSSRFWPADEYEPGHGQPSFDKQYVRDWLEESGWDKNPPAPALPPDIVQGTSRRYIDAYELITGTSFVPEGEA